MDRDQINSQLKEFDTATIERITETLVKKAHQEEEDNRTMLPIKGTSSSSYQRPVKKVKVRIKPTDDLGAAPMPEGYLQAIKKRMPEPAVANVPISITQRKRMLEESMPYVAPKEKKIVGKKVIRAAGGEVWEDSNLVHWDEDDYRLFAGDLGNEVTDELLAKAFSHYPSMQKTHVVRDKKSFKSKGYGFISFKNSDDYIKALREMNGKYVGHRPISLKRSQWKDRLADKDSIAKQKELAALAGTKIKGYGK